LFSVSAHIAVAIFRVNMHWLFVFATHVGQEVGWLLEILELIGGIGERTSPV
jgi:hypothetical protein